MPNYYNNINLRLFDNTIKSINKLIINDYLIQNKINFINQDTIQIIDVFTDINHFIIGQQNKLLVYNEDKQIIISVQDYIDQNLHYKMKVLPIEIDNDYSYVNAYYAGYDLIFSYLLNTSIKTRQHILAGIIDFMPIEYITNGISICIKKEKIKNNIVNLIRSLGYIVFLKQDNINILGDFSNIPVKEKKTINNINYNNCYIKFSLIPREKKEICYSLNTQNNIILDEYGIELLV